MKPSEQHIEIQELTMCSDALQQQALKYRDPMYGVTYSELMWKATGKLLKALQLSEDRYHSYFAENAIVLLLLAGHENLARILQSEYNIQMTVEQAAERQALKFKRMIFPIR